MKIRIEVSGYGNNITAGRVPSLFFFAFEDEGLEFDDYVFDYDYFDNNEDIDIPENIRPFEPGCYHEAEALVQEWGPELNHSNISIYQDDELVYDGNVEQLGLRGVEIFETDPVYIEDQLKQLDTYFVVNEGEQGLFNSYEFETNNFDFRKIKIESTEVEDMILISNVYYDGEELEDLGETNTIGKGGEAYLGIVKDEEDE